MRGPVEEHRPISAPSRFSKANATTDVEPSVRVRSLNPYCRAAAVRVAVMWHHLVAVLAVVTVVFGEYGNIVVAKRASTSTRMQLKVGTGGWGGGRGAGGYTSRQRILHVHKAQSLKCADIYWLVPPVLFVEGFLHLKTTEVQSPSVTKRTSVRR